jgi:chromosome segregation ATPase
MSEEDKNLEERMTRHFDVVLEGIRGDFKVFGEGLSDLSRKFDGLEEKVDNLTDKVEVLSVKTDVLTERVDVLTERVDVLTERVDVLAEKTDLLIEDMDYVKSTLVDNKEKSEKVDGRLKSHETRLVKLENSALANV